MNSKRIKRIYFYALVVMCLPLVSWTWRDKFAYAAAGYEAKVMCSSVFISGRNPQDVEKYDLLYTKLMPVKLEIDMARKEVRGTALNRFKSRAVYREGLGCTLVVDVSDDQLEAQAKAAPTPASPLLNNLLWPDGNSINLDDIPAEVDKELLNKALEFAFAYPKSPKKPDTRAVVVVYKGRIIAERYAPGFSKDTPLAGWSMTKSVTNALVGILVRQGKLDVHAPAPVPEWKSPGDPRKEITFDHLMRMSSGLKWAEVSLDSDLFHMMFLERDTGAFAASVPLAYPPGSK